MRAVEELREWVGTSDERRGERKEVCWRDGENVVSGNRRTGKICRGWGLLLIKMEDKELVSGRLRYIERKKHSTIITFSSKLYLPVINVYLLTTTKINTGDISPDARTSL